MFSCFLGKLLNNIITPNVIETLNSLTCIYIVKYYKNSSKESDNVYLYWGKL